MGNESVTILCIFNGQFAVEKPSDWNIAAYLKRKRDMSQSTNTDGGDDDDSEEELRVVRKGRR